MRGINQALFVGAIVAAPELIYTTGGLGILEVTLAGKSPVQVGDEVKHFTFYQRAKVFGKFAESLAERLNQGDVLAVEGRLDHRTWEGEKGKGSATELVGETVIVLDPEAFTFDEDTRAQPRVNEGVNEVTLAGNLTKDAEFRRTPGGDATALLNIAVNEGYGDKERTGFYRIQVWRELAEQYGSLAKGAGVIATGRLVNDSVDRKDGEGKAYFTTLEATRLHAVAGRSDARQEAAPSRQAPPPQADEQFQAEEDLPF